MSARLLRCVFTTVLVVAAVSVATVPVAVQEGEGGAGRPTAAELNAPTPRLSDGKPDLSGRWGGGANFGGGAALKRFDENGNYHNLRNDRKASPVNQERDAGMSQRFFANVPLYKPEFWERVDHLDVNGNVEDTNFRCFPAGVPRMGAPLKIMATPTEIVFLYQARNTWRYVPLNRAHDPVNSRDQSYMGDSIGRWEGDTLVVDVEGFNEESWIGWPGYFHTNKMRVEERFRRQGNVIYYQVTVHDPDVLAEPWKMDERALRLNTNPMVQVEDPPCVETDGANMYTKERG